MAESDPGAPDKPRETPLVRDVAGRSGASDELPPASGLAYSRTPAGDWDVKRAQHDLKVAATVHEQELERRRLEHELDQQARDNDNRRQREMLLFYTALGTGVVLLVVGLVTGVMLETSEAKASWARSIVTAILGAFAGYLTGKSTR